jgi:membrane fusion protein (multidrug efflux system)
VVKIVPGANKDELISERVTVKIGLRQPGKVEILEGLALGDSVVVAGQQRLQKDGTLVRIVDMSKGQAGAANGAPAAPGGAATGKPAEANANSSAKPSTAASKDSAKGNGKMPAVSGENPCLRGLNATR